MALSETEKSKRGRPRVYSTPIMVRLRPDELELLDLWVAANDPDMSRPEAMRRILRMVAMRVPKKGPDDGWMASFDQPTK